MNNFRFFVDSFGWPMMQYKISLTSNIWSPIDALPIQLWKVNVDGSPKSQTRVPSPIPYCPIWGQDAMRSMEKEKFISARLSKYMEFQKQGMEKNITYAMKMNPYVDYLKGYFISFVKTFTC